MVKVLVPEGVALNADDINATPATSNLEPYQHDTLREFQFKTPPAPQMIGIGGAHWEHLPMGSFPPQLDISIPSSFGNAIGVALNNVMGSVNATKQSLKSITQETQNAVCSLNDMVSGLQKAQGFAQDFADANNNTRIFVRPIGLQPPGSITSMNQFVNEVRLALSENGNISKVPGKVPRILPAEIGLNPQAISDSLGSGGSYSEKLLEGTTTGKGALKVNTGSGLKKLSNDSNFTPVAQGGGFAIENIVLPIFSLTQIGTDIVGDQPVATMELTIQTSENVAENSKLIVVSKANSNNNGIFTITSSKFESGNNLLKIRFQNPLGATERETQGVASIGGTAALTANSTSQSSSLIITGGDSSQFPNSGTIIYNQQEFKYSNKINDPNNLSQYSLTGVTPPITYAAQQAVKLLQATSQLKISSTTKIRSALSAKGLLQPGMPKTASVGLVVNTLVEAGVIASEDTGIATERLSRLNGATNYRVGGILLVGQAPDLAQLAGKITVMSSLIEFLKPLADELTLAASAQLAQNLTKTGIGFDPKGVQLDKLNPKANVAIKDIEALGNASKFVQNWTLPPLVSHASTLPQPGATNFHAWRSFSLIDFIPGLSFLNKVTNATSSASASAIGSLYGDLGGLIEATQQDLSDGLNFLSEQADKINKLSEKINQGNQAIQDGLNFLKNSFGRGAMKLDGHLIGADLNLLGNAQFVSEVKRALTNITDPNRPVFGPSPSQTILDTQQAYTAVAANQAPATPITRLWFGLIVFIVGNGREDLGSQMRSVAELLSMDTSSIDLPPKTRLKL